MVGRLCQPRMLSGFTEWGRPGPSDMDGQVERPSERERASQMPYKICARDALTTHNLPRYPRLVELFARSRPTLTGTAAAASPAGSFAKVAKLVQPHLQQVETRIAQQTTAFDPAIEGYVVYAVGSRGKRLRPLLTLLAGGATGKINSGHIDLAVIVELIHIATLVHDDVMDEAERRRAQPTANARWGNSLSVLLGDCLFAHALTLSTNFENADIGRAIARTAATVCSGEMIQTQRKFDLNLGVQDYLRIVEMKTGSLFSAAAELAAVISDAAPNAIEPFKSFGFQIGTAYQIYDDCVDLAGNERATGKTLGTDLRKGKFTLPVLIFLRSASEFERERCCQLVLEERVEEMIEILKNGATNGALNESIDAGSQLIRKAQGTLDGTASNPYAEALFSLGDALCEMFDRLRV
jgi:octaprenyl-diphosphate synthase